MSESESDATPIGGDQVLLVDDNPTNLAVLCEGLEEQGYELLIAQSGEEALEIAGAAQPALILLDINMPGMDGHETCRRLKTAEETACATVEGLQSPQPVYLRRDSDEQFIVRAGPSSQALSPSEVVAYLEGRK